MDAREFRRLAKALTLFSGLKDDQEGVPAIFTGVNLLSASLHVKSPGVLDRENMSQVFSKANQDAHTLRVARRRRHRWRFLIVVACDSGMVFDHRHRTVDLILVQKKTLTNLRIYKGLALSFVGLFRRPRIVSA